MIKQKKDYTLVYLGAISSTYFVLLLINNLFLRSNNEFLGIIQESITLPIAVIHIIALVMCINKWAGEKYRRSGITFWSVIIMILVIALFFITPVVMRY